jgi:hypothetical protein
MLMAFRPMKYELLTHRFKRYTGLMFYRNFDGRIQGWIPYLNLNL